MIATATRSDAYSHTRFPRLAGRMLPSAPKMPSLRLLSLAEPGRQQHGIVHLLGFDAEDERALCGLLADVGVGATAHAGLEDFLRGASRDVPSCLVVHGRISLMGGLDFLTRFHGPETGLPIIVVADRSDVRMAVLAMKAGVVDFLEKPFRDQELLEAVGVAIRIDRERREAEAVRAELERRFSALTMRERQVMALVTDGLLNKQVAGDLGLSEITVKVHRGSVMRKMGARTLAALVRMADALAEADKEWCRATLAGTLRSWR